MRRSVRKRTSTAKAKEEAAKRSRRTESNPPPVVEVEERPLLVTDPTPASSLATPIAHPDDPQYTVPAPGPVEEGNWLLPGFLGQPVPVTLASADLGLSVSKANRDKISLGEFVDLAALLPSVIGQDDQAARFSVSPEGQLKLTPSRHKSISSIEEWSDAFLIFASIHLNYFPDQTQSILKYMSTIRLAAKRHVGLGWVSYDTQFRLRVAAHQASYDKIDQELWLLCMGPSTANTSDRICYNYNYNDW